MEILRGLQNDLVGCRDDGGFATRADGDFAFTKQGDVVVRMHGYHPLRADRHVGPVEHDRRLACREGDAAIHDLDGGWRRAGVELEAMQRIPKIA